MHFVLQHSLRRYAQRLEGLDETKFQAESRRFMAQASELFRFTRDAKIEMAELLWESGIASAAANWIVKPIPAEPGSPQWSESAKARVEAWEWVWRAKVSKNFADKIVLPVLNDPGRHFMGISQVPAAIRTLSNARGEWADKALLDALASDNEQIRRYHGFIALVIEGRRSSDDSDPP
jgi:hypothetical protein